MVNYDNFTEEQADHFFKCIECLKEFRKHADFVMYYSGNDLSETDQKKFREAYDLVCKAMDLIN